MSIYLDNQTLINIYDKESGIEYLKGVYEKPNWVVSLNVEKESADENNQVSNCNYSCTALIHTLEELLEQSQADLN